LRAWQLEKSQIENLLDCEAMVSLTDHDNIDAGLHLSMLEKTRDCPISVEWTVPWRETFFHLGLHNLPTLNAGDIMRELEVITANPSEDAIATILDGLHSIPQTLVVMNHPVWDEKHIGSAVHARCVESFLTRFKQYIHALELNGLRPWNENIDVIRLASDVSLPLISGGDRHAREPNACVNLTNAATFAEFVDQIRQDGRSDVLFMPQYREAFKLRIVQNICDVLEDDPDHSLGWTRWSDRVFYLGEDGSIKSLHELWGRKFPPVVNHFVGLMSFARHPPIRSALRTVFHRKQKFAL